MTAPIVCLHGFSGHGESWAAVRAALPGRRIESPTAFGHDISNPVTSLVAFDDEVARVATMIRGIGSRRAPLSS